MALNLKKGLLEPPHHYYNITLPSEVVVVISQGAVEWRPQINDQRVKLLQSRSTLLLLPLDRP